MALNLAAPTGRPAWPTTLLAGGPGHGKTYTMIEATSSPIVSGGLVLTLGEGDPDEYALLPGARFDKVLHDGTYASIAEQVREVAAIKPTKKPLVFGFDGFGKLWPLIVANKQAEANRQARDAARAARRPVPLTDAQITGSLWDAAHMEWQTILNMIRTLPGPSILTTRMDDTEKGWKLGGEKSMQYDVTAVVQFPAVREYVLTKGNSLGVALTGAQPWPDFTMDALWRRMELDVADMAPLTLSMPRTDAA
jgi:hypothetical protein